MRWNFYFFNLVILIISVYFITVCDSKPPVVIVPGDGGSRLQARLNKKTVPHFWCEQHTKKFYDIWLSIEELLPEVIDCWSDNMRLVYNKTLKQLINPEGVEIRVPYFGGTNGIEYLDASVEHPGEYFAPLVDALVKLGYVRGQTVRAAPYDFRHAPNGNKDFLNNLKHLIEETVAQNNGDRIVLVSHSLGCPYTKYFLDNIDQTWKDKYIHSWVTIAGAWGGAAKLFRVISSGTDLGAPEYVLKPIKLRAATRTYGSSAFLLPSEKFWKVDEVYPSSQALPLNKGKSPKEILCDLYWENKYAQANKPIVHTSSKNYSISNLDEFYKDMQFDVGQDIRNLVPPVWTDHPPNVTLYCLYGTKVPTPEKFYFGPGEFPDTFPKTILGDGDGTVNRRSLEGCKQFMRTQVRHVTFKEFPGAAHMKIIGDNRLINFITNLLESID